MRLHYSFSECIINFIHKNSSSQGHLNILLLVCAFFALKKKTLKERTLHLCFWMKVPKST